MVRLIQTSQDGYTQEAGTYRISDGILELTLPPFGGAILVEVSPK